ncbi:hypothetical protein HMPREF1531_02160 [Propionibacterium sp. oral taxon 192 str. F0372]|uniref:hypothetical protein n=1 Tax=Propionibacterium sp. oral taxon 192 TaxID=671222 RepID=UPI0003549860|nr:hypothetical protein [Propionibacterium sp. oral taxon 192]EPH02848.1 hypothetical protein HMPREF1531_02160 [Propionibacterium sp. oral taxon 192 str. F0372]
MRTTRLNLTITMAAAMLFGAAVLPAKADTDWDRGLGYGRGNITTSSSGGSARVGASVGGSTGGGVVPAANGEYVSYPDGPVGENAPAVPTQICRLVHAGEIDFSNDQKSITVCYEPTTLTTPTTDTPTPPTTGLSPHTAAAFALAQLSVPAPQLTWSPDPANNEWNAWAIALPIWVDFPTTNPITTTTTASGITIDMAATQSEIHIDWGDATTSTCTRWGPMPRTTKMGTQSPWCGHTWTQPATYTVTTTSAWTVTWTTMGQTGTLPLTSTSTTTIDIAEFQAIVTG